MGGVGGVGGAWRLRLVEWVLRSVERVDAGADRSVRAVELDQEAVGLRPLMDGAEAGAGRLDATRRLVAAAVLVAERQILLHPTSGAAPTEKLILNSKNGGTSHESGIQTGRKPVA